VTTPAPGDDAREDARIAERNRLILRVMEIDAKRRHFESLSIGLALEAEHASRQAEKPDATPAQREAAAGLKQQFELLTRQLEKFAVEREWLDRMLAELDGAAPPTRDPRQGNA
jgi:hypothetical protein